VLIRNSNIISIYDVGFNYRRIELNSLLLLVFLVKIPIFGIHFWLPKAHVEAPTIGSIQLAGVLLKLGGYGIKRLISLFKIEGNRKVLVFILSILIILGIATSFQRDNKKIVAYMSVCHINFLLLFLFLSREKREELISIISLRHGVCSSSLFFIVGEAYRVSKTRIMYFFQMRVIFSTVELTAFLLGNMSNLGVPPLIRRFIELRIYSYVFSFGERCLFILFLFYIRNSFATIYFFISRKIGKKRLVRKKNGIIIRRLEIICFSINFLLINIGF